MELVLQSSKDAVGTQQFLFGLAVKRDAGIMLQTSNWVFRTDEQSVSIEGLGKGLAGSDHLVADGVIRICRPGRG